MNKFLNLSLFLLLAFDLSSNTSLEITTIEIQDSYNTIQRFPGKILPLNYSKLAFEIPGKISEVKIDIGDAVKINDIETWASTTVESMISKIGAPGLMTVPESRNLF